MSSKIDKLCRNNTVGVIYSPGYGAGWYSWNKNEALLFDPNIILFVETNQHDKIPRYVENKYPGTYVGGYEDLKIDWLPIGTAFEISEYDGYETIKYKDNGGWIIA